MRRSLLILCSAATVLVTGLLGGCYERVVRAEGPTAYKYDVYESNLKNDGFANEMADAVFGDPNSKSRKK